MNGQRVVLCVCNGTLFSFRQEGACDNIDEPKEYCAKLNKPHTEAQITQDGT
jgi:hypothetical protein